MSTVAEVITPERYQKGLSYAQYLPQTGQWQQEFENVERAFRLPPEDAEHYRKLAGKLKTVKSLVLVEDHSPDVYRALPILNQIAVIAGMEVRIFRRDENPDIMDLFLNRGQFRTVPTVVFFDKNLRQVGIWIERPAGATKLIDGWREELAASGLGQLEIRAEVKKRREPYAAQWLKDTAGELKEVLTEVARKIG